MIAIVFVLFFLNHFSLFLQNHSSNHNTIGSTFVIKTLSTTGSESQIKLSKFSFFNFFFSFIILIVYLPVITSVCFEVPGWTKNHIRRCEWHKRCFRLWCIVTGTKSEIRWGIEAMCWATVPYGSFFRWFYPNQFILIKKTSIENNFFIYIFHYHVHS